jgi:hypothetical protein
MGNYATYSDVRAEGFNDPKVSNSRITSRIAKWEAIVEKMTGQVYRKVSPGELTFNGSNSHYLHFSVPLIEVTSVKINGSDTALIAGTDYRAFTGLGIPQDDRQNPKIELLGNTGSIFSARSSSKFLRGADQLITASWGFVEDVAGTTPAPIKDAIVQLVMLDLDGYFDQVLKGMDSVAVAPVKREKTDGHEIEFGQGETASTWSLMPRHIADIFRLYRGPWLMAAPTQRRFAESEFVTVASW